MTCQRRAKSQSHQIVKFNNQSKCKVSKILLIQTIIMNQSSTSVGINLRSKGIRNNVGTLVKGCVKDATTKLSIGSIPSNYQTIIYRTQSAKAFGTSQKRFYQESKADLQKTDIPNDSQLSESTPCNNPSHSKKGYGPFIAKEQRVWIQKSHAPGPGRYEAAKTAEPCTKRFKKRPCFTRERKQNIVPNNQEKKYTPGPGQYYLYERRNANNGWKSSFKTKVDRDAYLQLASNPGPGSYDVKLGQQTKCVIRERPERPERSISSEILQVFDHVKPDAVPGPGSYQYDYPTFKPLYQRIKISGNFMLSKKDRFNNQTDKFMFQGCKEQSPNVCSYNLKSGFDEQQRLIKWPCFMSESKRMVFSGEKKLGPSFITPKIENRRNFHFNIKGSWF